MGMYERDWYKDRQKKDKEKSQKWKRYTPGAGQKERLWNERKFRVWEQKLNQSLKKHEQPLVHPLYWPAIAFVLILVAINSLAS